MAVAAAAMEALIVARPGKTENTPHHHLLTGPAAVVCSSSSSSSSSSSASAASPSSSLRSSFLCALRRRSFPAHLQAVGRYNPRSSHQALAVRSALGENPDWSDDDFLALGRAHCFRQDASGKIEDIFLVEPVSGSTIECMDNGGATCYTHITASTLGVALKEDPSLLPPEFADAEFCDDFSFRAKCASRTWKRQHAVDKIRDMVPAGAVLSNFNFSLTDKRIINKVNEVTDEDNIKQDLSIDVYGRKKDEAADEVSTEIASLYNA